MAGKQVSGKKIWKPKAGEGQKLIQIPLDEDLHARFKSAAVLSRTTMNELVEGFVEHFVAQFGRKKGGKQ